MSLGTKDEGQPKPSPVDVAVAVIEAPGRRFLLAQRPPGKPMAGYWEFPGGKVEAGESVKSALVREIDEELGVAVLEAHPWVTMGFVYPHATVRLHFMRVVKWQGTPASREHQAFRFEHIDQLLVEPWLPGALPLKRWLQIEQRYAISDATGLGVDAFCARLEERLQRGSVRWLLLREPELDPEAFDALCRRVLARARSFGTRVLVSSRHPERYWHEADGVHLTRQDLVALKERPPLNWVFASCHSASDLALAADLRCDAAMLGSVQSTLSHPGALPLGWTRFGQLIADSPLPVFALGGLAFDQETLRSALSYGAQGIAAQRAAWQD